MSEWLKGRNTMPPDKEKRRLVFNTVSLIKLDQFEQFASACRDATSHSTEAPLGFSKGANWLDGQLGNTLFNSVLQPNLNTCMNANQPPKGAWTASSHHPGGVNTLFGDGHVSWVKSTIKVPVWRALGTRNGGEIHAGDSY
jgi:prepilin-type processing-associated H-X9-DG protein